MLEQPAQQAAFAVIPGLFQLRQQRRGDQAEHGLPLPGLLDHQRGAGRRSRLEHGLDQCGIDIRSITGKHQHPGMVCNGKSGQNTGQGAQEVLLWIFDQLIGICAITRCIAVAGNDQVVGERTHDGLYMGNQRLVLALRRNGALYRNRLFLRLVLFMGPTGLIAMLAGWITTEVGRQPWVVYGLMRTADAVSNHTVAQLSISLALFVVIYFSVFAVGIGYMMKLVRKGPQPHHDHPPQGGPGQERTPRRPLSAVTETLASGDHTN